MKKELYKNIIKRLRKGAIYLAVLISVTLASVISMVSMRKNMVSSIDKDTPKMFSSNTETIDNMLPVNNQTVDTKQDKAEEKISYVTYEEKQDKQAIQNITDNNKDNDKELNSQLIEEKEGAKQLNNQAIQQKEVTNEKDNLKQDAKEAKSTNQSQKQDVQKSSDVARQSKKDISKSAENSYPDKQNLTESKEVFFGEKKSFIAPLSGKITNDFSDDKLIYSKTLDEWRVHQGIDIEAKEGTNVKAVLDGYVEEIKNDDEYGVTVVVRHSKSLVSVYKNLANEIVVLPNQIVKQGDVVGLVGTTGKIETNLSPHIHFEMLKNNKLVDPKMYVEFKGN